jgi:hypothetical protein
MMVKDDIVRWRGSFGYERLYWLLVACQIDSVIVKKG